MPEVPDDTDAAGTTRRAADPDHPLPAQQHGCIVTLVGTIHIGEVSYYETLHATVVRLEAAGAVVLYEASRLHLCSIVAQGGSDRPGTREARTSEGPARAEGGSRRRVRVIIADTAQADAFAGAAAAVVFRLVSLDRFDRLQRMATWDDASRRFDHVTIAERDTRALAGLPSGSDAVLLWGAAHLPGLAAGLKRTGHSRQATTWVNVGRLPALWASIRTVVKYYPAVR